MIGSFRDRWLEAWFERDVVSKRVPAVVANALFRKLQLIDDATTDADLRVSILMTTATGKHPP
jgi:toxin HigB-1